MEECDILNTLSSIFLLDTMIITENVSRNLRDYGPMDVAVGACSIKSTWITTMIIGHISDSHVLAGGKLLSGRFDTGAAFGRLMRSLAAQPVRPDLLLFSGDLGEDATLEEYAMVGDGLRRLGVPVLAVPGNHDAREPMWARMSDMLGRTEAGHLCVMKDDGPLAIIGLDTIVPGAPHGELCPERLSWLKAALDRCEGRPVLIFQHHPPITTGLEDLDSMGLLAGRDALAKLVARHGKVVVILCGHVHRSIQGICGGAPVRVCPSASHQFAFDLRPGEPYRFSDEPAQYMIHLWRDGETLVSHTVPVAIS